MPADTPRLGIKAASLATGISVSRLRAWESRYAIPAPSRSNTGRRLYSDDDLAQLRRMLALVHAGFGAREAADAVREPDPLAAAHPMADRLAAAARRLDEQSAFDCIWDAVGDLGWRGAIDRVLLPALDDIASGKRRGLVEVIHENFLSELVREQVSCAISRETRVTPSGERPQVILASRDERDDVRLIALNLLVRQLGATTMYLGAGVSGLSLFAAISHLVPAAAIISCQTESARAGVLRVFMTTGTAIPATRFFLTGAAFRQNESDLPGTVLPASLASAATLVRSALD